MKLIFMGTPEFAVPTLARLIADKHEVAAVFTQPDKPSGRGHQIHQPPVKSLAVQNNIPVHQPSKIKTNEDVRQVFTSISPDACIVTAYGKILPEWLLAIPKVGCINVHASLLPKYRGAAPINWAIANGETETGVTIMQMDAGMDTGPMLAKRSTVIDHDETAIDLSPRLAVLGAELLSESLPRIERGELQAVSQIDADATYAPILKREDGLIDWRMPARSIANRVRAFQPWPSSYTIFRGKRLIIWRATEASEIGWPETAAKEFPPGTVVSLRGSTMILACGEATALRVEEVQFDGKRRMSASEFANGARLKTYDCFHEAQHTDLPASDSKMVL